MNDAVQLYLELMKRCLMNTLYEDPSEQIEPPRGLLRRMLFKARGGTPVTRRPYNAEARASGMEDWPVLAHTMVGRRRLDNLEFCIRDVVARGVPGDLIETGVWRGGATIFMRAVLKALGVLDRRVWVADSFAGLPAPGRYPQDAASRLHECRSLFVSLAEVRRNFDAYGLLDDQVVFLPGWFKDTLPAAPIEALAVARLDGDMYESTLDALQHLYPRLQPGGYLIVDDYGLVAGCRQAVQDFRAACGIADPLVVIDGTGVYWQRQAGQPSPAHPAADR